VQDGDPSPGNRTGNGKRDGERVGRREVLA